MVACHFESLVVRRVGRTCTLTVRLTGMFLALGLRRRAQYIDIAEFDYPTVVR